MKIEDKGEYAIMHLSGTAQALNKQSEEVQLLRNSFKELSQDGKKFVLVNLKDVDYLASNTIGALLSGNSIFKKNNGKVVLYGASEYIMGIFNIVRLGEVLPICETLEDALAEAKR